MTTIFSRAQTALPTLALVFAFAAIAFFPWNASAATASFDSTTLSSEKAKPTISGEADVKTIRIEITNEDDKRVWRSGTIKVRNDEWKTRVKKSLKDGEYEIAILDSKKKVLETDTLVIGKEKQEGTLTASMLPLLVGGTARMNGSVPVAYVRIGNPGKTAASIDGIALTQRGSANVANVISFATSDDKGGSRATVAASFKNGSSYVPLKATIAPGQTRIFTIKANLGSSIDAGKTLMFDVASVDTNAKLGNAFPLRGVTWNLAR